MKYRYISKLETRTDIKNTNAVDFTVLTIIQKYVTQRRVCKVVKKSVH